MESIMDRFRLYGKTAIVTGSGRGIGRAIALGLADAGADVVGVDIRAQPETKAAVEATGRRFLSVSADLSTPANFDAVIEAAVSAFGAIHILVNNAGITRRKPALDFSEEEWNAVISVNQTAVFFNAQRAVRQFVRQGTPGKIVNIASVSAYEGGMKIAAYTATKAAVVAITKTMSNEWSRYQVNANAVAPGFIHTDMTEPMRGEKHRVKEVMARVPLQRWGAPEDIAGAVIFLASDAAAFVNGTTLVVDGGYMGR